MKIRGKEYRTIWGEGGRVRFIDQTRLPHAFVVGELRTAEEAARAIRDMGIRGAGAIGAAAGYGMYLAARRAPKARFDLFVARAGKIIAGARPTAINLVWAVERQLAALARRGTVEEKIALALKTADDIADEDAECSRRIGRHGLGLIRALSKKKKGKPVNVLTHCNAGWLAFVDHGTATAPIYAAREAGIPVHVWVSETRPRNQGAKLTAWELLQEGVSHHVIADNAAGHLLQNGMVDLCLVGTDRTTRRGDVANKIGTYLKALAAKENGVPFYVALPSSSFDWRLRDGRHVPIEERGGEEVAFMDGWHGGKVKNVRVVPRGSPARNFAFDVTPARFVTGLITERGICKAEEKDILRLFPEHA